MSELTLKKLPEKILRKKVSTVTKVTSAEKNILTDMARMMYLNSGVGLAANQVGVDKQLAVIDVGEGLIKMINPSIVKKKKSSSQEEGCLSVPNVFVKVKRAKAITVDYLNEEGEVKRLDAEGLLARAIQHEIDHLNGKLIIDYLNPVKRLLVRAKAPKG